MCVFVMIQKRPNPKPLSATAEKELQSIANLCRRLRLSAAQVRKMKRIIRIMYEPSPTDR